MLPGCVLVGVPEILKGCQLLWQRIREYSPPGWDKGMERWMDGWMDRWMDKWMDFPDGEMDGWMDRWISQIDLLCQPQDEGSFQKVSELLEVDGQCSPPESIIWEIIQCTT